PPTGGDRPEDEVCRAVTAPENTTPAARRNGEKPHGGTADNVRGAAKRSGTASEPRGGTAKYVGGAAKRSGTVS
ncbi:hypothetical protein, partial [Streptomyces sp. NPDC059649]|uniref:hypothetical protein n=1 Tax=Streptomyces sp. NPDC059649 TaxID=3346895 RepID=UPI00367E1A8E